MIGCELIRPSSTAHPTMGRSYWFECSKCGYRATISGKADKGLNFAVQTVVCRDCKQLFDAVTRIRVADDSGLKPLATQRLARTRPSGQKLDSTKPPSFQAALNRLSYFGVSRFRWVHFKLRCPVSTTHKVQSWNAPGRCPRCGVQLEQNAVPYRIWD